eukprot:6145064-Amphidinium_carterae.1
MVTHFACSGSTTLTLQEHRIECDENKVSDDKATQQPHPVKVVNNFQQQKVVKKGVLHLFLPFAKMGIGSSPSLGSLCSFSPSTFMAHPCSSARKSVHFISKPIIFGCVKSPHGRLCSLWSMFWHHP